MNRISQFLVFPIVWFFSTFFFRVEFINEEGLAKAIGKPMIIIANHISFYDSFLLRLNKHWTSLSVFFMGVVNFNAWQMRFLYRIGLIKLVYTFFGVFVVKPGLGIDKNLGIPKKLLLKNNQVFIFPEGSVNKSGMLLQFKKGTATLSIASGVGILPIAFKNIYELGKKKRIVINIGDIITLSKETDSIEATRFIQNKFIELLK